MSILLGDDIAIWLKVQIHIIHKENIYSYFKKWNKISYRKYSHNINNPSDGFKLKIFFYSTNWSKIRSLINSFSTLLMIFISYRPVKKSISFIIYIYILFL